MFSKKNNPIVTELFIGGRKLNICLVFITQSYFALPKNFKTKFNTIFHYGNSKQTRASTNCV